MVFDFYFDGVTVKTGNTALKPDRKSRTIGKQQQSMTENKSGFTSREQQNMRGDKRRTFGKQQHSMTEKR